MPPDQSNLPAGVKRWHPKYTKSAEDREEAAHAGMRRHPDGNYIHRSDLPAIIEQARQEEREKARAFVEAICFEAGCMRDYADKKPGMLGKLAGEMVEPIEAALDSLDSDTTEGG